MDDKLFEISRAFETLRTSISPSQYVKKDVLSEYDRALSQLREYVKIERRETVYEDAGAAIDCLRRIMPLTLNSVTPEFIQELVHIGWKEDWIARLLGVKQPAISNRLKEATEKRITKMGDGDILSVVLPRELRDKPAEELSDEDRAMIAEYQLYVVTRYGKVGKDKIDAAGKLITMYRDRKVQEIAIQGKKLKIGLDYLLSEFLPNLQKKIRLAGINVDVKSMFRDALMELRKRWEIGTTVQSTDEFDRAVKKAKKRGKWVKKDKENE